MEKLDFAEESQSVFIPFSRGELAKKIVETPVNVILEYIEGLQLLKDRHDRYINVFNAIGGHLMGHHIDELTEDEFIGMNQAVEILNDQQILKKINDLVDVTINPNPLRVNNEKINEIIDLLQKIEDFKKLGPLVAKSLDLGRDFAIFNRIILYYLEKEKDIEALRKHLRGYLEENLDRAISSFNGAMIYCQESRDSA